MLDKCAEDPEYGERLLCDPVMAMKLCRVGSLVDFFIGDFAGRALACFDRGLDGGGGGDGGGERVGCGY